ncbi:MAG: DUF4199 domain-containing protein [Flavobacteriales bacterium]|jgi:hypothetical protein|nr:DUF4199 domain-containing protein [Flavobacteriales bacterium]MDP4716201.1 DUF4199 domain-containing protein [Flavobacteriales bacterium]MDP4732336.1 DUF4199 domain-containing protein [Flavobacteriales bacterium]MDP4818541.1 DUF4199 domain-containing protein [Flavobacteriales bacterium]MDP4950893.1 DUF4199 domain-containing protein [Flavobacteriales bacterium]
MSQENQIYPPSKKEVFQILFKFGIGIALGDMLCEQLIAWFPSMAFIFELFAVIIIVFGLTLAINKYKSYFEGFNYGKALWFCLRIGMVVGLVKMFFTFIQLSYIDNSMLIFMTEEIKKSLTNTEGISRDQLNEILNSGLIETFVSPPFIAIMVWIGTFFQYLFIGLFISIFHRKSNNPFQQA